MSVDDTRARILDAAGEVFAERGYRSATVREICRRAEVNVASVNYYFGGKEQLYIETVRAAHPAGPEPALSEGWPEDTTPDEKIHIFIHKMFQRLLKVEQPAWKLRLLQREILEPTPFCMEMMKEFFRSNFSLLMNALDEILPPDMPKERRHKIGLSIIGQCVYFRAAMPVIRMIIGEEEQSTFHTIERLTEHVSSFVLAGLGLAPPLCSNNSDITKNYRLNGTDRSTTPAVHTEHPKSTDTTE